MDEFPYDPIIDEASTAHHLAKYQVGSLWWVSEAIWRQSAVLFGRTFCSQKRSHPGTILNRPLGYDQEFFRITSGRTTKPGSFPSDYEVFVELRPAAAPMLFTRFGGFDGFIGQIASNVLLQGERSTRDQGKASECWINRNEELPHLDADDLAVLVSWLQKLTKRH